MSLVPLAWFVLARAARVARPTPQPGERTIIVQQRGLVRHRRARIDKACGCRAAHGLAVVSACVVGSALVWDEGIQIVGRIGGSHMKTAIVGGTVVTAADTYRADVLIEDEKIVAIGQDLAGSADTVVDASGRLVIPGGID